MPIYVYDCLGCQGRYERYLPMSLSGQQTAHLEGCAGVGQKVFLPPMVMNDLPGYDSPIDGRWIEGRRARVEDLKRHNCRPYENGEKEYNERRRVAEEASFDRRVEETVEREFCAMPARKKELLAQEVQSGTTAVVQRQPVGE